MKILSLLICFAMMLSGAYTAEDPNAPASTVVTIRDAVVYVQDEEYPLNPSITFGASTAEGGALIDFGMPLGENVLFPVQAKIDENGLGVLLGKSSTAYTFTPEFFDSLLEGEEIPEEIFTMLDAYSTLLGAVNDMPPSGTSEQNAAIAAKFLEIVGELPTEEAEFYADGRDQTGTKVAFSLDNDQVIEIMEASLEQLPADYLEAYYAYMNAMMSLSGGPEITSYADTMAATGMAMAADGEITYNETSAVADLILHMTMDPYAMYDEIAVTTTVTSNENADAEAETLVPETTVDPAEPEPVSIDVPVSLTIHSADRMDYNLLIDMEGVVMDMSMTIDGSNIGVYAIETVDEEVSVEIIFSLETDEDGHTNTAATISASAPDLSMNFNVSGTSYANMNSALCEFSFREDENYYGASWTVDVGPGEITDRFIDAERALLNSVEEVESNPNLPLAAMSMMGDAEKLMNDESVMALVELLSTPVEMEATVEEEVEIAENTEPIDLPAPEFGWLPEGYVLDATQSYSEDYYNSYTFVNEELGGEIYIEAIYYTEDELDSTYSIYLVNGDESEPLDGSVVYITRYEDGTAHASCDSREIFFSVSCYNADLTDEEIIQILTNITFAETAE